MSYEKVRKITEKVIANSLEDAIQKLKKEVSNSKKNTEFRLVNESESA